MSEHLARLLTNKSLCMEMGMRDRQWVEDHCAMDQFLNRIEQTNINAKMAFDVKLVE